MVKINQIIFHYQILFHLEIPIIKPQIHSKTPYKPLNQL